MNADPLDFSLPQGAALGPDNRPSHARGSGHGPHPLPAAPMAAQRSHARVRNSKFLDAASLNLVYVMTRPQAPVAVDGVPQAALLDEVTWVVCADPMALETPARRHRLALQLRQARAAMGGATASGEPWAPLGPCTGKIPAGPA